MRGNGHIGVALTGPPPAVAVAVAVVGGPLPLITGEESLTELRKMIIRYSEAAQQTSEPWKSSLKSPFIVMGTLSYASLNALVNSLSRKACLELFRMELNRRTHTRATAAAPNVGETS